MTPSLRMLFYYLWIAPHILQVVILTLLFRRGVYLKVPVFTAYSTFAICNFAMAFAISRYFPHAAYFQWYSFGLGIEMALRLGVICEIFSHVFAHAAALHNLQKPLFRWTTVAFLIVAVSFAVYTHRSDVDPTWFAVYVLDRSANIVLGGLILTLFVFSHYLDISWSRLVFGIALGFGILCSLELATTAMRSHLGRSPQVAVDLLDMSAYLCCVLIWLFYLITPERKPPSPPEEIPEHDLELWNHELERLLTR